MRNRSKVKTKKKSSKDESKKKYIDEYDIDRKKSGRSDKKMK